MKTQNQALLRQTRPAFRFGGLGSAERLAAGFFLLLVALPVLGQTVLYDNGPDAETGYYRINFGAATINSFDLSEEATVSNFTLTIYNVDDRNTPKELTWTISTQPSGGIILASGSAGLSRLQDPYLTRFLFFAWNMGFAIPNLRLPRGTYFIGVQDVVTKWDTWAFWAVSSGPSAGFHSDVGPSEFGVAQFGPVASESFAVLGEWTEPER